MNLADAAATTPCPEIYAAPYSCPRGRVENNTSESVGDEGTT